MRFSTIFNVASAWLCTSVPVQALTLPASYGDHPLVARDLVNSDTLPQRSRYWHKEKIFNPKWEWQPHGNKKSLGKGLFAYVLDFGVDGSHPELAGRVSFPKGANFVGGDDGDKNGHGTQIASVIAGESVGLVPGADIISVKIGTDDSVSSGARSFRTRPSGAMRLTAERLNFISSLKGWNGLSITSSRTTALMSQSYMSLAVSALPFCPRYGINPNSRHVC